MKTFIKTVVIFVILIINYAGKGQIGGKNVTATQNNLPNKYSSNFACPTFTDTIFYTSNMVCEGEKTILHAPAGFIKWEWSDGSTKETDTVGPGTYTVTVTDANNCIYTTPSVTVDHYITVRPAISASGPTTFCDGDSVFLRVSGGFISSILWNTGSASTFILVKNSGSFTVTTKDGAHGCSSTSDTTWVVVNQPTYSDTVVNACVSYTWNGVTYTHGGIYTYKTKNVNGCDSTATLHLSLTTLSGIAVKTNAKCYGSATGTITVTAQNGTPPYMYRLGTQGPLVTSNVFMNLRAGKYIVFITDSKGCIGLTNQVTIQEDPPLTGTYTTQSPTCFGGNNGSITLQATSGVAPFQYKLGTSNAYTSNNTFNNLKAGVYRATLKDDIGCTGTITNIIVSNPPAITASFDITNVLCHDAKTGQIAVLPTSGSAPFLYKLGTAGSYTNNSVFSGLRAGNYLVYVKDNDGCVITKRNNITQPNPMFITINKGDESCPGAKDGFIQAEGGNGTIPYLFKFGTAGIYDTIKVFNGLRAGSYRIYVRDHNGCQGPSVGVNIALIAPFCFASTDQDKVATPNAEVTKTKLDASLYPNPSTDFFTLKLVSNSVEPIQVKIISVNGKVVSLIKALSNQQIRFGSDLASGVYLVDVQQGETRLTLKAVKIK